MPSVGYEDDDDNVALHGLRRVKAGCELPE